MAVKYNSRCVRLGSYLKIEDCIGIGSDFMTACFYSDKEWLCRLS
jgi:hypothetical protein